MKRYYLETHDGVDYSVVVESMGGNVWQATYIDTSGQVACRDSGMSPLDAHIRARRLV